MDPNQSKNILTFSRTRLMQYVVDYSMERFKDEPFGLDYVAELSTTADHIIDGSTVEQFCKDLVNSGCTDLINYIQVKTLLFPIKGTNQPELYLIFAKKDFINNIVLSDFAVLDDIINLMAKRTVVNRNLDSLRDIDMFDGDDLTILEDHNLGFPDYFYGSIETSVMNAVSKELGVVFNDNYTWLALVDYVLDYIEQMFPDALLGKEKKYEAKLQTIIEKRTLSSSENIGTPSIQDDINSLLQIQKSLQDLSDSSQYLSRYFNNRSFAFTEEVISYELERLNTAAHCH